MIKDYLFRIVPLVRDRTCNPLIWNETIYRFTTAGIFIFFLNYDLYYTET